MLDRVWARVQSWPASCWMHIKEIQSFSRGLLPSRPATKQHRQAAQKLFERWCLVAPLPLPAQLQTPGRRGLAFVWLLRAILVPSVFCSFANLLPFLPQDARFLIWLSSSGHQGLAGRADQTALSTAVLSDETDLRCENTHFTLIWRRRIYPADVLVCNKPCLPDLK